jgi:predicted deacylase
VSDEPKPFELGGVRVEPGHRGRVDLPAARLTTGSWMTLPVEVVHGTRPGPTVWLSGALHGDELDGVEIVRRVLGRLRARYMGGTVLAVPIVNVFGFLVENRYLPDRRDLNRSFPGSARGSMASRLAHLFMHEVVRRCSWGFDFHCGSDARENLPQVRGDLDDPETHRVALAFGAPVTIHGRPPDGSLRKVAVQRGARVVLFEGGEAGRFTAEVIESGVEGVLRALRALEVTGGDAGRPPPTIEVRRTSWLRAGRSGILRLDVRLGDHVQKGQRVGLIADALGDDGRPVRARTAGMVIGRRVNPLVYQGEAVVNLAEV